jgi:hypothetical protein
VRVIPRSRRPRASDPSPSCAWRRSWPPACALPRQRPHAVRGQPRVGRIAHVGFHNGRVDPRRARPEPLLPPGLLNQLTRDLVHHLRAQPAGQLAHGFESATSGAPYALPAASLTCQPRSTAMAKLDLWSQLDIFVQLGRLGRRRQGVALPAESGCGKGATTRKRGVGKDVADVSPTARLCDGVVRLSAACCARVRLGSFSSGRSRVSRVSGATRLRGRDAR